MNFFLKNTMACLRDISNTSPPCRYEWLLVIVLVVVVTLFLHANALNGYWRFDDGAHLMFATEFSPAQYFFDPPTTRAQSSASVTPWNVFFYDLNLSLFGFEPRGFYAHLLFLLVCTALALYALLRLWLPLPSALLGVIVFLAGKPTDHLVQELMSNHYLMGMLFSLLSLNFFISHLRHNKPVKLMFAALFYALAMTCKEVYVPLILLLFVIPGENFTKRLQAILPFVLVAISYTLWRHAVLGTFVGGYVINTAKLTPISVMQQFVNIPFLLFDSRGWGLTGLIILTIMSLIALWKRVLNIPLVIVAVVILFIPLLPLTLYPGIKQPDRYLFVIWTAISICIAIIFQSHESNRKSHLFSYTLFAAKSLGALSLIIACFQGLINEKQRYKNQIQKAESIYHFAIEADFSQKALMLDARDNGNYWILVSAEARRAYDISKNLTPTSIVIIINTLYGLLLLDQLAEEQKLDLAAIQFYQYRKGFFSPTSLKPLINASLKSLNEGKDKILQITFSYEKEVLKWEFKPEGMVYSATLRQEKPNWTRYSMINLPEKGSYPLYLKDKTQLSLCIKASQGWIAVSPKFNLEAKQQTLQWQGKTDLPLITDKLKSLLARLSE